MYCPFVLIAVIGPSSRCRFLVFSSSLHCLWIPYMNSTVVLTTSSVLWCLSSFTFSFSTTFSLEPTEVPLEHFSHPPSTPSTTKLIVQAKISSGRFASHHWSWHASYVRMTSVWGHQCLYSVFSWYWDHLSGVDASVHDGEQESI